ncbi:MAG: hypothetical protein FRX49_09307 [Trebouxia sp. A1-2]|nr:MAG: hypothetical protein FRX49_09307 [Trebouxia sp. A1-2]
MQQLTCKMHEVGRASNAIWQPYAGTAKSRTSPVNNLSVDNRLNPETDVMLRVECMSSRALKALLFQGNILHFLVFAVLLVFVVLQATHHTAQAHKQAVFVASAVVGGICTGLSAVQAYMLVRALQQIRQLHKRWTSRRRRLVIQTGLSIGLVLIANVFWMTQNAYAASKENCRMYATFCRWSESIVWTMLNCWLFLQLVLAHAATTWTDSDGKPLQHLLLQRKSWLANCQHKPALVFDAPWAVNLTKFVPWAVLEASLILELVGQPQGQAEACAADVTFASYTPCHVSSTYKSHGIVAYVGLGLYLWFHTWYVRMGRRHHSVFPYSSFRIGLVLMRTQEGNSLGVSNFLLTVVAWLLTVIFRPSACIPCLQASTHIALMLAVMRLVVAQSAFFIPKTNSRNDPIVVQEWMQFFAWTEHTKSAKHAERQSHMPERQQKMLMEHPIFCFETAIKLLYWCGFVYEHDEGRNVLKLMPETALGLFKLDHFELVRCKEANVKCIVAWSSETLLVAFRGTANVTNAFADIRAWMVSQAPMTQHAFLHSSPKVHSGFHAAWDVSGLKAAVTQLIKDNISAEQARHTTVFLTGHSLGGAMANLAALDLAHTMEWASVKVYTVGAPRAGNHAYAKMYNKVVPDTWGIINYRDPVPQMAKFWFLYARPGNKVLLYKDGDMIVCPTPLDVRLQSYRRGGRVSRHKLTSYRASLVEVIRAQVKSQRLEPGLQGVMDLVDSVALKACREAPTESNSSGIAGSDNQADNREVLLDADADMTAANIKTRLDASGPDARQDCAHNPLPPSQEKQPDLSSQSHAQAQQVAGLEDIRIDNV